MAEFRAQAAEIAQQPRSTAAAVVIVLIWIAVAALAGWWLWRSLGRVRALGYSRVKEHPREDHDDAPAAACAAAIAILMPLGFCARRCADASPCSPRARAIRWRARSASAPRPRPAPRRSLVFNFIPTSADNVAQQTALAEEALRSKPDAVVFTPTDPKALVPVVAKFAAAGYPGHQRQRPSRRRQRRRLCRQRRSRDRARHRAGAAQGDERHRHGRDPRRPAQAARRACARVQGFNDALKEFPNVKLLTSQTAQLCAQAGGRR